MKVKIGTVNALDFQHVTLTLFSFKPKTLDGAGKIKDRVTFILPYCRLQLKQIFSLRNRCSYGYYSLKGFIMEISAKRNT